MKLFEVTGEGRIELFRLRSISEQAGGRHGLPGRRIGFYPVTISLFPTKTSDKRMFEA